MKLIKERIKNADLPSNTMDCIIFTTSINMYYMGTFASLTISTGSTGQIEWLIRMKTNFIVVPHSVQDC